MVVNNSKRVSHVPELPQLHEIRRPSTSVSNVSSRSSRRGHGDGVDLKEGCLITNIVKFTHELAHFVNAVRDLERDYRDVEGAITELAIIPFRDFDLDHPCNRAFLDASIHTAFGLYAFIAIVPSSSTLDELIQMVKSDNDRRQHAIDAGLDEPPHSLKFTVPCFANPQYELITLHPEHFLPYGCLSTVYDRGTSRYKNYVVATDRCLRESVDPASPPFPPFYPRAAERGLRLLPNVYLVALNAEIKCRRYFAMISTSPPEILLPDHVVSLMRRTMHLVELIYWRPTPTKGSEGGGSQNATYPLAPSRRRKFEWPADMDLEARMAYGRALMSGHDRDYDPALFDGAFEMDASYGYSHKANVASWRESVVDEN